MRTVRRARRVSYRVFAFCNQWSKSVLPRPPAILHIAPGTYAVAVIHDKIATAYLRQIDGDAEGRLRIFHRCERHIRSPLV